MSLFNQKSKIIILIIFLFSGFFTADVLSVSACWASPSCVADELEKRYHLNLESIRNQGEFFNISDQKKYTPEVSLFFTPNDPKEGEKISAKAFPMYFSNSEKALYYTWYLKRGGCDLRKKVSKNDENKEDDICDPDDDGLVTVEDWKIAAARIIAQNGYDGEQVSKPTEDDDGYRARFGGENKSNVPNHCYIHDPKTGKNHEIVKISSEAEFGCPSGTSPVCVDVNEDDASECSVSDIPDCSFLSETSLSKTPQCDIGSPRCVDDSVRAPACSDFSALSTCSTTDESDSNPICRHLFPHAEAKGEESGDGAFGGDEEEFWGTDPNDPDTADNGNKDEANVVGLGQQTFTWNYAAEDKVGVVMEGTSMIQTKHDDSSFMIMWAFSKNDCPISLAKGTGSYTETIKGYSVVIPTVEMDLNDCLEDNLVDPTEGGQATNLEVAVTAVPDNPVNDETGDKGGDTVIARASVSNAKRSITDTFFEWKVEISNNVSFRKKKDIKDITDDLRDAGLLGNTEGNALDSINVKLDMSNDNDVFNNILSDSDYVDDDGIGYLRFKVIVIENFAEGMIRKGRSDVIVKFTSSEKKIKAYKAEAELGSDGTKTKMKVVLHKGLVGDPICEEDALDSAVCRIIRNEVIGLEVDTDTREGSLSNFHWTINGTPLLCSRWHVSEDCADEEDTMQNNVNFFPVTGNVGDTYTVAVTANNKTTGNILTLTRTFHIVEPIVSIKSLDESIVWPKLLGQYRDITGVATECPGGLCNDYSTIIFQTFTGSRLGFRAAFIPGFLKDIARKEWRVDGEIVEETNPGEIYFTADKMPGEIYNVELAAQVPDSQTLVQFADIRRALLDIWNISPFDSTEINFATAIQVELKEQTIVQGPFQNERKYLAALVSYVPASLLFTLRIFLSAGLVLFAASFLYSLLQDRRDKDLAYSITGRKS